MERRRYSNEELKILSEIQLEALSTDPVYQRCRVVTFLSQSAGRGRKRNPREVQLLIIDGKYTYQFKDGEVKSRRDKVPIDIIAMEILTDLPMEERIVEKLLERAMKVSIKSSIGILTSKPSVKINQ